MRYERWTGNGRRYGDAECDFVRALTRNQAPRFTLRDARQDVALLEGIHCSRQGCDPGGPGRDDLSRRRVRALAMACTLAASCALAGGTPAQGQAQTCPLLSEEGLTSWIDPPASSASMADRLATLEAELAKQPRCLALLYAAAREASARGILTLSEEEGVRFFRRSQEYAERALALHPSDVEARYLRAAALGLRLQHEKAGTKIRLARDVWTETKAILLADPLHAGAHHLQGRLHAGVMRMGGFTRFLAHRLVGGALLGEASWALAECHLAMAAELAPGEVLNHLELGVLYRDTGRPERARSTLERLLALESRNALDDRLAARATALLGELRE